MIDLVVQKPDRWLAALRPAADIRLLSPRQYLADDTSDISNRRLVINLSDDFAYQSHGYYVSLLAEARKHRVLPSVSTVLDLGDTNVVDNVTDDLDELVQKILKSVNSDDFTLEVFFGQCTDSRYAELAKALFQRLPLPLFRATFEREPEGWYIRRPAAPPGRPKKSNSTWLSW